MKTAHVLFLLLFFGTNSFAESLDSIPWYKKLNVDVVFSFDRLTINEDKSIHEPQFIIDQRKDIGRYQSHEYDFYTDNPFLHFSTFAGLQLDFPVNDNFNFHGDLYAEHRGFSYGYLTKDIMQIFPQLYLEGQDTLDIFGEKVEVKGKLGDMIQYTLNHGLTASNNDFQGGSVMAKWKGFYFRYLILADAIANQGINLDEFWSYKLGWEGEVLNGKGILNTSVFRDRLILTAGKINSAYHYGIATDLRIKGWKFFFESSLRDLGGYFLPVNNNTWDTRLGLLAGVFKKWECGKDEMFSLRFDVRNYGRNFNTNYIDNGRVTFRERNRSFFGNYVGERFYPLKNAYRPFQEWAVYTQFQNVDLFSSSLQLSTNKRLWKDFYFNGSLETMYLNSEVAKNFFYNFYTLGLSYNGFKGFKLEGYITNKVMNLDVGFQTFYQSNLPIISYRCIRWFGEGGDEQGRRILN